MLWYSMYRLPIVHYISPVNYWLKFHLDQIYKEKYSLKSFF